MRVMQILLQYVLWKFRQYHALLVSRSVKPATLMPPIANSAKSIAKSNTTDSCICNEGSFYNEISNNLCDPCDSDLCAVC